MNNIETALCIWEAMLAVKQKNDLAGADRMFLLFWEEQGTTTMRRYAGLLAPEAAKVWELVPESRRRLVIPYDWNFIPKFLSRVDWSLGDPCVMEHTRVAGSILAEAEENIYHAVLDSMQQAEELGGPDPKSYYLLMHRISREAAARAAAADNSFGRKELTVELGFQPVNVFDFAQQFNLSYKNTSAGAKFTGSARDVRQALNYYFGENREAMEIVYAEARFKV